MSNVSSSTGLAIFDSAIVAKASACDSHGGNPDLGLTATVAVVTYINGFYQPFPGVDASGLYQLFGNTEESPYLPVSYLDFEDYAKSAKSFKGITASASNAASVRHTNETEVAFVEAVSGNFFSVLEVPTPAGQRIRPEDDVPGAPAVAVLSHAWWSRSFAGSKAVIVRRSI